MSHINDKTMALAGLIQSCMQVHKVARHGLWHEEAAATCVHSLFQLEADSVNDIYGSSGALYPGLRHLKSILEKNIDQGDMEITRYALTLLHLERKLVRNSQMLDKIRQNLYQVKNEFDIEDIGNSELMAKIAQIYSDTVSTIQPKVQVEGSKQYLSQSTNMHRVRVMLFTGIRSAVLWRQLGGTRFGLLFGRNKLLNSVDEILAA